MMNSIIQELRHAAADLEDQMNLMEAAADLLEDIGDEIIKRERSACSNPHICSGPVTDELMRLRLWLRERLSNEKPELRYLREVVASGDFDSTSITFRDYEGYKVDLLLPIEPPTIHMEIGEDVIEIDKKDALVLSELLRSFAETGSFAISKEQPE